MDVRMTKVRPVMQGLTHNWLSAKDWVAAENEVNIDFLAENFGEAQVTVSDTTRCKTAPQVQTWMFTKGQTAVKL